MKMLLSLLTVGFLSSLFAAGLNISINADRDSRAQQTADENSGSRYKHSNPKEESMEDRRNALRNKLLQQRDQRQQNARVQREPARVERAPARVVNQERYNERYGRYNQNYNDRRVNRRIDRRQEIREIDGQIAQSRQNLQRSRQDVRMYQEDLNFFTSKRTCFQRARDQRELEGCERDFR